MKYLTIVLIALTAFGISCKEEEVEISALEQLAIDIDIIDEWLTVNNIPDPIIHTASHIRYTITETGTGISPWFKRGDSVQVDYEGRLLETGEIFDSGKAVTVPLDIQIDGWIIMLPEMREGDDFTIYLPSIYGFGTEGQGSIPPNAVIVFDIKLIKVSN